MTEEKQGLTFYGTNLFALLPLIIFAVFCVLFFVVFKVFEMDTLAMGGFVALGACSILAKKQGRYWEAVIKGMSSPMVSLLALILLMVGIFAKLMAKGGVAQGFVWLGSIMGLHGGIFVAFTFVITALMATATGTSIGTLFSAFPILYPSGILLGAHPTILAGAILSGAIFGDNIGPISDTTIASCSTQNYTKKKGTADIGGAVTSRMRYALAAGLVALVLFAVFGGAGTGDPAGQEILSQYTNPKGLIMLIPVSLLLAMAIVKRDIFIAIVWGTICGIIIGLISGILVPADIISVKEGSLTGFCYDGIRSMLGMVGYLYGIAGIMGVLTESGTLDKLIRALLNSRLARTEAGSELIIALGVMISSISMGAANGPAIVMFGPIANEIGQAKKLHPYRRANLLDGCAATLPVVIPVISAFIFIVITIIDGLKGEYGFIQSVNPVFIALTTFHCLALFVVFAFSIISGWGRRYEGEQGEPVKQKPAA
ncbi:MAG: Na+/H+ antiporter NhaC family protein [Treponema sp.]|jgi:Na+/H+ antiporter NhaC|nr:Na+/H+ antiporter NhaC family protein [Treponema sp.]